MKICLYGSDPAQRGAALRPSDIAHRLVLSSGGTSNVLRRLAAAHCVAGSA